jgi:hypothetical protein
MSTKNSEKKIDYLDLISKSELLRNRLPNSISHAETKGSGFSLGKVQFDLAQHPDKREELLKFLKESKEFEENELKRISVGLSVKGSKKALSDDDQEKINEVLDSEEGLALTDGWDQARAGQVEKWVDETAAAAKQNPRYSQEKEFRDYVDSAEFKAHVADNANQFGNPTRLKKYLIPTCINHDPLVHLRRPMVMMCQG